MLTVTTEQQLGSPTTVANVIGQLNNNKEGLPVTHDDLQRPVRVIPENTRENSGKSLSVSDRDIHILDGQRTIHGNNRKPAMTFVGRHKLYVRGAVARVCLP